MFMGTYVVSDIRSCVLHSIGMQRFICSILVCMDDGDDARVLQFSSLRLVAVGPASTIIYTDALAVSSIVASGAVEVWTGGAISSINIINK